MKIDRIMKFAVEEGIKTDPRPISEINKILEERRKEYSKLEGQRKEIYDTHLLESPYADTRIVWGNPGYDASEVRVSIDVDTSDLLLVKKLTENTDSKPLVISHHPEGRAYSNFYEVMDMQSDILQGFGIAASVADSITNSRKHEVARRVSPVNHFQVRDAARLLNLPLVSIHTPADNHVTDYLGKYIKKNSPRRLNDLLDLLLQVLEYLESANNGQPPWILSGEKSNKCGRIFVDMTGGTENDPVLLGRLAAAGVSTVVAMHMSDKHYEVARKEHLNVVIAGHISSDNIGLNLLLDKIENMEPEMKIISFGVFFRVRRNEQRE